jgi:hypothetical protein
MYGDVDCNGKIEIADAILLARYNAEDAGANVTSQGLVNANCKKDDVLDSSDLLLLLQCLSGQIKASSLGK